MTHFPTRPAKGDVFTQDVVVHLLQKDAREYYDLDRLYQDCERLDWQAVELPAVLPS